MGEIAEMMVDGTLCCDCGDTVEEHIFIQAGGSGRWVSIPGQRERCFEITEAPGYPVRCAGCRTPEEHGEQWWRSPRFDPSRAKPLPPTGNRSVDCPTCGAPRGYACMDGSGRTRKKGAHARRVTAALAAQEQSDG